MTISHCGTGCVPIEAHHPRIRTGNNVCQLQSRGIVVCSRATDSALFLIPFTHAPDLLRELRGEGKRVMSSSDLTRRGRSHSGGQMFMSPCTTGLRLYLAGGERGFENTMTIVTFSEWNAAVGIQYNFGRLA